VGLGGVGGNAAETLARGGVGRLTLLDGDVVDPSNRNRQLVALLSTEGEPKAHAIAARLLDINPHLKVDAMQHFVPPDSKEVDALLERINCQQRLDWIVDCIDSLQPKVELIRAALKQRTRVISTMGAGGRLDPCKLQVTDLSELRWDRKAVKAGGVRHPCIMLLICSHVTQYLR
jgi:tRNA A37 threonylcarbamoyladenosine dehydratase